MISRLPRNAFFVSVVVLCCASLTPARGQTQDSLPASGSDYQGPVRIAKLLWKSNAKNAASTLRNSFNTALDRGELPLLRESLKLLGDQAISVVEEADGTDPRYAPSLTIALLSQNNIISANEISSAIPSLTDSADRELLWRVWLQTDADRAFAAFEQLLRDSTPTEGSTPEENSELMSMLVKHAIAAAPQRAAEKVLAHWQSLPSVAQVTAIEPLTGHPQAMLLLINAVREGIVNRDLLNTNQLRKWIAAGNAEVTEQIESVWGRIRLSDNAARQMLVSETIKTLRSGVSGSVARGEKVFERVCSQCHQLHGKGFEVGPNISGNGRGSLDQLVSNVLDPSLVIGEAFQAKLVLTTDGEVLSGLKVAESDRYLKIKLQGGKIVELDKENDIEEIKDSDKSLMPEGLEEQLTPQEMIDLFAFLSLLKPLGSADNELIPGAPDQLVEP